MQPFSARVGPARERRCCFNSSSLPGRPWIRVTAVIRCSFWFASAAAARQARIVAARAIAAPTDNALRLRFSSTVMNPRFASWLLAGARGRALHLDDDPVGVFADVHRRMRRGLAVGHIAGARLAELRLSTGSVNRIFTSVRNTVTLA